MSVALTLAENVLFNLTLIVFAASDFTYVYYNKLLVFNPEEVGTSINHDLAGLRYGVAATNNCLSMSYSVQMISKEKQELLDLREGKKFIEIAVDLLFITIPPPPILKNKLLSLMLIMACPPNVTAECVSFFVD